MSWGSAEAGQVLKKSFIMFCLDLFLFGSLSFPLFQTALQTLELFLTFCSLAFYDISDSLPLFVSISSSVLLIKAAITLSSSFSLSYPGLLVRRCYLFDCVPALVRKFFFCHPLSLCERVNGCCKSYCKVRSLTIVVPVIVSSSLRSVPLQKMLVCQSPSVLSVVAVVIPKY